MKKSIVFISLISAAQLSFAAKPATPWLTAPQSAVTLATNLPVFLSWDNLKDVTITGYRVVVSSTPNFSGYNPKSQICTDKTTCFVTSTKLKNYMLRKTGSILKNDNNYYWRVEAINREGVSISDTRGFVFGTSATALDPKYTTVLPSITSVGTDLATVEQGKPLVFSATTDLPLPAGSVVKVNYGNGFITMNGTGTNFTLNATPTKSATYSIGIYDARNNLKSNVQTGKFTVTKAAAENVKPVLKLISNPENIAKVTVNAPYSVQLSATDVDGNLKEIFIDWGDGSSDLVSVEDGKTLAVAHTYPTAGSFTWKASADDYGDLISDEISQAVTVAEPVKPPTTPDPTTPTTPAEPPKKPRYSAIDSTGADTKSGLDWKCTRDDETGLVWELKTNDQGLHSKKWSYSWYDPNPETNGGFSGVENSGTCRGSAKCNTAAFIDAVNAEKFCGGDNWRLPTKAELEALVTCSDEQSTTLGDNEQGTICTGKPTAPTIDTTYFPNTNSDWFWTSNTVDAPVVNVDKTKDAATPTGTSAATTPPAAATTTKPAATTTPAASTTTPATTTNGVKKIVYETSAWNVIFYHGYSRADNKGNAAGVRLVRKEAAASDTKTPAAPKTP